MFDILDYDEKSLEEMLDDYERSLKWQQWFEELLK